MESASRMKLSRRLTLTAFALAASMGCDVGDPATDDGSALSASEVAGAFGTRSRGASTTTTERRPVAVDPIEELYSRRSERYACYSRK